MIGGSESLQGFNDQCLGVIASRLRQAAFASGEVIFEYGERGDEMFLLVEGAVVLHAGPGSPAPAEKPERGIPLAQDVSKLGSNFGAVDLAAGERITGKGDVFGEGGLFPEELGPIRLESAKALSFVSAYVLTAASMREIEAEYPAVHCLHISLPLRLDGVSLRNFASHSADPLEFY
jgi:CRP-like cAMP-binding protein